MANTSNTVEIRLVGKDEISGVLATVGKSLDTVRGHIESIKGLALGNLVGNLGADVFRGITSQVKDFGASLIDSNAQIELMRNRLNILYQSTAEGAQAFAFLKQNELIKPFDIQSIMEASTRLVAFKQDITTLLPAIEDIAGSMGVSLQRVAIGFDAALAGRFAILRNIGISKQELASAGAQFDKGGHLTDPSSLARAFIELSQTQFKGGADKMGQTWNGLMSSMSSQWFYFKSNLGSGAFQVLEQQLHGLVHTLQDPANAAGIQRFELAVGAALGKAAAAAISFGKQFGPYLASAIVFGARAWDLIHTAAANAINLAGGVVAGFVSWLKSTGFPALENVLKVAQGWWDAHSKTIKNFLSTIGDDISAFVSFVGGNFGGLMTGLGGAVQMGMGLVQATFGGGLDLMSGNWHKFQDDFNGGVNLIITGAADMVAGIEQTFGYKVGTAMLSGLDAIWHNQHEIVTKVGSVFSLIAATAATALWPLVASVQTVMRGVEDALKAAIRPVADHLGFLLDRMPHGHDMVNAVLGMKDVPIQSPADLFSSTYGSAQALIDKFAPGDPSKNLHITAGVTDAQFRAAIEKRRQQVIADMTGITPARAGAQPIYNTNMPGAGKSLWDDITGLFAGLGGKMTMASFIKALGFTDLGKGLLQYKGTGGQGAGVAWNGGPLPVLGYPTGDAAAAAGIGAGTGQRSVTGRVPLGAVGATFGQSLATLASMHAGTDPATRAAQKQVDQQQTMVGQGDRHTALLTDMVNSQHTTISRIEALISAVAAGHAPQATPPNHLRSVGVLRPKIS